jgi:hypothetical protein
VVVLLFRGEYPRSIFDFVLGLNRWVLRVAAYAAVMTPAYPPFRVDPGEEEPAGGLIVSGATAAATADLSLAGSPTAATEARSGRWGPGRVTGLVVASVVGLLSLALLAAGGAAIVLDQTQRDSSGYLMTSATPYSTSTYALVSDTYRGGAANDWFVPGDLLGTVRVRASSSRSVFVGIGPASAVTKYLAGVARAQGDAFTGHHAELRVDPGGAPSSPPGTQRFWDASATGAGTQTLTWEPQRGNWRVVVMNADGSAAVSSEISVGARLPHLLTIAIAALGAGILLLAASGTGVYLATRPTR